MKQTSRQTKIKLGNTELILNSRSWGPMLIIGGAAFLIAPFFNEKSDEALKIFKMTLSSILVIFGLIIMLIQLRSSGNDTISSEVPDASEDIEHAINQLNKNYEVLRKQTTQGFIFTGTFMLLGLLVILTGAFGTIFGLQSSGLNLASISGIILEFISGSALVIYRLNFNQLNIVSDKLHSSWKYLTAFRKAETLQGDAKESTVVSLINNFVSDKTMSIGKSK